MVPAGLPLAMLSEADVFGRRIERTKSAGTTTPFKTKLEDLEIARLVAVGVRSRDLNRPLVGDDAGCAFRNPDGCALPGRLRISPQVAAPR